jgi:hypothetical protein
MFVLYTTPLQRILKRHDVMYHKYADDIQIYQTFNPSIPTDKNRVIEQLTNCICEVRQWMTQNWLMLNDDKTEVVTFQSKLQLKRYGHCSINIGDTSIASVEHVRNLGVRMDEQLSLTHQVTAICAACNFHLHRLSSIRRYLTTEATKNSPSSDCNSVQALL